MSTMITLAALAALAGFVYHYMPKDRPGRLFRLEQFCAAAPLAGILDDGEDSTSPVEHPDTEPTRIQDTQSSDRVLD